MKKYLLSFIALIMLFIITACNGTETVTEEKIVPIYQGVNVVTNSSTTETSKNMKHDVPDINVDSGLSYFVKPNEKFNLVIHLTNPSQFEILSITINEIKYQTFEFVDGSNSENIILSVTAPSEPGVFNYYVDNIKYIDKQAIKDVDMSNGNKSVDVGITYQDLPTVSMYDMSVTYTTFNAMLQIVDNDNILANSNLRFYVFDQDDLIVFSQVLEENIITVDSLRTGANYHYVIALNLDILDGNGSKTYILAEGDFRTAAPVDIKINDVSYDSFNYEIINNVDNATISTISLIDNNGNVINIKDNTNVSGLLSNSTYQIELVFSYQDETYHIYNSVSTLAYEAPTITKLEAKATNNSITYESQINDLNNLVNSQSVSLYKGDELVKQDEELINLLSNTEYRLVLSIYYDLNDGNGIQSTSKEITIKTSKIDAPTLSLKYNIYDLNFVGELNVIDEYNIFNFKYYELCDDEGNIIEVSDDINYVKEIKDLKSNAKYQINVIYSYDLNEGNGIQEEELSISFSTAKQVPTLKISPYSITESSIGYDIIETDPNVIGEISAIRLFDDDNNFLKQVTVANSFSFDSLNPNTNYIIKIYYNYDLDDGTGSHEIVYDIPIKTAKREAVVDFELTSTTTSISLVNKINDIDNSGSIESINVYHNNVLVFSGLDLTYNDLLSNNEYRVELIYKYDLNDLKGSRTTTITKEIKTIAKVAPTITFNNVINSYDSISLDYTLVDNDNIFEELSVILYYNNQEYKIASLDDLSFNDLYSNSKYNLVCTYRYDLNDGNGSIVETTSIDVQTKKYEISLTYTELSCTNDSIYFDYNVNDLTNSLKITKIELLDNTGKLVAELTDLSKREFNNLTSSSFYTIVTTYTYDLKDNEGTKEDKISQEYGTSGAKVNVIGFEVINSDSLLVGREIHIRVKLDNPNNLNLTALYINDVRFDAAQFGVDGDSIIIRFVPETLGGSYDVVLTGYSYLISVGDDKIELKENLFTDYVNEVFVLGDLGVSYFGSSRDLPFAVNGQKEISLKFDGTKGYQIESIETSQKTYTKEEIEVISDSEVRISSNDKTSAITLKNVEYSLEGNSTIQSYNLTAHLYVVDSDELLVIDEASDFANLESYHVYVITKDIDFSSVNGNLFNKEFNGVIIGDNHKLLNFSLQSRLSTNNIIDYGLFSRFTGYVENITFVNPYIIIEDVTEAYAGVFAGAIINGVVNNVVIENAVIESSSSAGGLVGRSLGGSTLTNIAITGKVSGKDNVGGVMGIDSLDDYIAKALNKANISGNSYVGGIVGHIYDITINEAVNYGTIIGVEEQVGGIIGGTAGDVSISNAINYGMVTGYLYVGGIVGYVNGAGNGDSLLGDKLLNFATTSGHGIIGAINTVAYLSNCLSSNSLTNYNIQAEQITNCYTLDEQYVDELNNIYLASKDQIMDKEFWLELGFAEDIWNLDDLANYPTLKFASNY